MILNSSHYVITNHSEVLGIPVVQHNKDEGLYKCVVNSKKQNISKFITVIVKKGRFLFRGGGGRGYTQQSFIRGGSAPRSNILFWTEKVTLLFSIENGTLL